MSDSDEADRLLLRGPDLWVRMKWGREIRLGPVAQVEDSMKAFLHRQESIAP